MMPADDSRAKRLWWLLLPFGLAAWALAAVTVGREVPGELSLPASLGVAGLAVLFAAVLPRVRVRPELAGWLATALVAGGVLCALAALALEWRREVLAAEQARWAAELVAEPGPAVGSGRVSVGTPSWSSPLVLYLNLLSATGLVALGVRVTVPAAGTPPHARGENPMSDPKRLAYDLRHDTADAYAWLRQFERPDLQDCPDPATIQMLAAFGKVLLRVLDELQRVKAELAALKEPTEGRP